MFTYDMKWHIMKCIIKCYIKGEKKRRGKTSSNLLFERNEIYL